MHIMTWGYWSDWPPMGWERHRKTDEVDEVVLLYVSLWHGTLAPSRPKWWSRLSPRVDSRDVIQTLNRLKISSSALAQIWNEKKHITHKAEVAASPFGASIALSNGRVILNCDFSFRLLLQLRFLLGRAPGLRVFRWTPSKNSLATRSTCNVQRANVQRILKSAMFDFDELEDAEVCFRIFHERHSEDLANWCYGHGITWKQMEWRHKLT